jgi:caa(3)-type oxidase subunit IV
MEVNPQDEFQMVKRIYVIIVALTALIIGIHMLHLGMIGIVLIVLTAVTEASILAYFFMHLMTRKKTVHMVLLLTVVVFLSLLFWPAWDVAYSPRTPSEFTRF